MSPPAARPLRLLLIEDDQKAAALLRTALVKSGHTVEVAHDGKAGLEAALSGMFDVLIVDRMLPRLDGLAVIAALRTRGLRPPVLILSALGEADDRVTGLRAGGDDYLVKPFALPELLARLEALARRAGTAALPQILQLADLELDRIRRTASRDGRRVALQPREFRLLEYLMMHAGRVVTRRMLLENVWDCHFDPQTNVVEVHISRLRGKIDRGYDRALLHTARGQGYMLRADPEQDLA